MLRVRFQTGLFATKETGCRKDNHSWSTATNLMADVAKTWPLELMEKTIIEASTTIKSERYRDKSWTEV